MKTSNLTPIAKAIAAFLAGAVTVVSLFITLASDGLLSAQDFVALGIALVTTVGGTSAVYQVPNKGNNDTTPTL